MACLFSDFEANNSNFLINDKIALKGKGFTLNLNNKTGVLKTIKLGDGKEHPLKQSFKFYKSNHDNAYSFCAEGNVSDIDTKAVKLESVYSNGLVHEVKQQWNDWISQTIRVYEDQEYIELDWVVGPIPLGTGADNIGKELISRFETDFNNNGVFYTDANGRQNVCPLNSVKINKRFNF